MTPKLSYAFAFDSYGSMAVFAGLVRKYELSFRTVQANTSNKIVNQFIWSLFEKVDKLS